MLLAKNNFMTLQQLLKVVTEKGSCRFQFHFKLKLIPHSGIFFLSFIQIFMQFKDKSVYVKAIGNVKY